MSKVKETVKDILQQANDHQITLYIKQGKLAYIAKQNQFPTDLKQQIAANKEAIIAHLQGQLALTATVQENQSYQAVTKATDINQPQSLSFAQQRLWFVEQLHEPSRGVNPYHLGAAFEVYGSFDVTIATVVLNNIIEHHHALRTVFVEVENSAEQQHSRADSNLQAIVKPNDSYEFTIALQSIDRDDSKAIKQAVRANVARPFDLSHDLMLRAEFIDFNNQHSCAVSATKEDQQADGLLLLCMHHIASDGWSIKVLLERFIADYQDLKSGRQLTQTAPKIQYADFALWQKNWLNSESYQSQLNYWLKKLADTPPLHNLARLAASDCTEDSNQAGKVQTQLPEQVCSKLLAIAKAKQLTPFMLLHGAFAFVLSIHSNQKDIVVGTAVANRQQLELTELIGFFTNSIVLRTHFDDVDNEQSNDGLNFWQWMEYVKQVNLEAQANQDVPFEKLVESLGISRSASHSPIFQIMFNMNTVNSAPFELDGVRFKALEEATLAAKFDLELDAHLFARNEQQILQLNWLYDSELFSHAQIAQMSGHMADLLTAIAQDKVIDLHHYQLLTPQESDYLLVDLNQQAQEYWGAGVSLPTRVGSLTDWFEYQVTQSPEKIAVVDACKHFEDAPRYSYQWLNQQANRLARYLIESGVKPNNLVGLCTPRGIDLIIAILAVQKAGGAYVSLDPSYPIARLVDIVQDSQMKLILATESTQTIVSDLSTGFADATTIESLAIDKLELSHLATSNVELPKSHEQLAYLIYTSGSTGKPKGVMIAQANVLALMQWALSQFSHEQLANVLFSTSVNFDIAAFELYAPLLSGGTVIAVNNILQLTPAMSEQYGDAAQLDISLINTVPSAAKLLLDENASVVSHKVVGCFNLAGELLTQSVVERLYVAGVAEVNDLYGPSEDTTYSTCGKRNINGDTHIGRTIGNTYGYILDNHLRPVPFGVAGQLYLTGAGVSLGYWQNRELTEKAFVANPFVDKVPQKLREKSQLMYATGDLVRYNFDGSLCYLGRLDDQVKVRGFRIELGEIAQKLSALEGVKDAIAVAPVINEPGQEQQRQLVAYVVLEQDLALLDEQQQQLLAEQLKGQLADVLPNYMVPHGLVFVAKMPLNANGKVDKKRLPKWQALSIDGGSGQEAYIAPSNEIEQTLVDIWAKLLGLDDSKLGIKHNFFSLGGDSILAIQMVSAAAKAGWHIQVKDVFDCQNIASLGLRAKAKEKLQVSQQLSTGTLIPLPIAQNFFATQVDLHHYNQSLLLTPPDDLQFNQFEQMLSVLVKRHDALRLCFNLQNGLWQGQFIDFEPELIAQMLTEHSLQNTAQLAALTQDIQQRFDLHRGPLFRVALIECDQQRYLFIVAHHLLIDGVSWRVILQDLHQLVAQATNHQVLALSDKTHSYQYWCEQAQQDIQWLQQQGKDGTNASIKAAVDFWHRQFTAKGATLSDVAEHKNATIGSLVKRKLSLSAHTTQTLLSTGNQIYATKINELLLVALSSALASSLVKLAVENFDGVLIDVEGHGRESFILQQKAGQSIDVSQTVGWFTTIYPLFIATKGIQNANESANQAWSDLILAVKDKLRTMPQAGMSFGLMQQAGLFEQLDHDCKPAQVVFNYLGQFDASVGTSDGGDNSPLAGQGFTVASDENQQGLSGGDVSAKRRPLHPLSIDALVSGGQLHVDFSYDPLSFKLLTDKLSNSNYAAKAADFIDFVQQNFATAIEQLLAHLDVAKPRLSVSDFPLCVPTSLHEAENGAVNNESAQHHELLTQDMLDKWQQQYAIGDIYPSSQMQQGLLFHTAIDKTRYVSQISLMFKRLNLRAWQQAWQQVACRHDVLSCCFVGNEGQHSLQLVVDNPVIDWQIIPYSDSVKQLAQQVKTDHYQKGFEVNQAPLMRMALICYSPELNESPEQVEFVWTHHHALLDGWSMAQVFADLSECYQHYLSQLNQVKASQVKASQAQNLAPVVPYKNYLIWLQNQDTQSAKQYWQQLLQGIEKPTPLPLATSNLATAMTSPSSAELQMQSYELVIDKTLVDKLRQQAAKLHQTFNGLVQGAWALLLSRYSSETKVCFGTTVSGRPAELAGVESMVGLFINSLPLVIDCDAKQTLTDFAGQLTQLQSKRDSYGFLPLAQIQKQGNLKLSAGGSGELFNSIMVSENHSSRGATEQAMGQAGLEVQSLDSQIWTTYPLSLVTYLAETLTIKFEVNPQLYLPKSDIQSGDMTIAEVISQISEHLHHIISQLANLEQHQTLVDIELMTTKQYQQVLSQSHCPEPLLAQHGPMQALFLHQQIQLWAASDPDAIAVEYEGQTLSYGELDILTNRLAQLLIDSGVESGASVGILLDNSLALPVSIIAIHKSGSRYVALDSSHPNARLAYIIEDADIEMVLTTTDLLAEKSLGAVDFLTLDELGQEDDWLAEMGDEAPQLVHFASDSAYILYTSGSSGKPKGVNIAQLGLINYLAGASQAYLSAEVDIQGGVVSSPLCFDATITSLLVPLYAGKTVRLLPQGEQLIAQLAKLLMTNDKPWLFKITPAHLQSLSLFIRGSQTLAQSSCVAHKVVVGGEQLTCQTLQPWLTEHLPNGVFCNEYGPTETVVGCAMLPVDRVKFSQLQQAHYTVVPVGFSLANSALYVVDTELNLVPNGVAGELLIGGDGVAHGYINRNELSAESFIYVEKLSQGRVYRSGDLVYRNSLGELVYQGRIDNQIKIRGYRIDPDDIAATICQFSYDFGHDSNSGANGKSQALVSVAFVQAEKQPSGQQLLVGYVQLSQLASEVDNQISADIVNGQLKDYLTINLPGYMVPAVLVVVDSLPLSVNGKVDGRALSEYRHKLKQGHKSQRALNDLERAILAIWQQVLKQPELTEQDNYFASGGDSILSIQIVSALNKLKIDLSVQDLFTYPTVASLAAHYKTVQPDILTHLACASSEHESRDESNQQSKLAPSIAQPFALLEQHQYQMLVTALEQQGLGIECCQSAYPMSQLQQGMVYHSQLAQFSGVYHDINIEFVQMGWDERAFNQALSGIFAKYPILRCQYLTHITPPVMWIKALSDDFDLPVSIEDLSDLSLSVAKERINGWQQQRAMAQFDWGKDPLFNVKIFILAAGNEALAGEAQFALAFSFHHSVLDGWSRMQLLSELYSHYQQAFNSHQSDCDQQFQSELIPDWGHREFVALELAAIEEKSAAQFFERSLMDAPSAQLPRFANNKSANTNVLRKFEVQGLANLGEKLVALAKQLQVPVQLVLMSVHFKLLALMSGQSHSLSSITVNGRPESEQGASSVGLFLNTLPMCVLVNDVQNKGQSWRQLVLDVYQQYQKLSEYRRYPISLIERQLKASGSEGIDLAEALFNFTHFHLVAQQSKSQNVTQSAGLQSAGLQSTGVEVTNFAFLADFSRAVDGDEIYLNLCYQTDEFSDEQIERMASYYVKGFELMIADVDACHHQSLLSQSERAFQRQAFYGADINHNLQPNACHIIDYFDAQVASNPQATALIVPGSEQNYSYLQLSEQVNRLACHLRVQLGHRGNGQGNGSCENQLLGLYFERSAHMVVGILAVLKAGMAYVPLDPQHPSSRLITIIEQSQMIGLLSTKSYQKTLTDAFAQLTEPDSIASLYLDEPELIEELDTYSKQQIYAQLSGFEKRSTDLAYVIFTSGSTGLPKGVMLEHDALINRIDWMQRQYNLGQGDRVLQKTPYTFDVSVWEFVWPMAFGATLVVAEPNRHGEPRYLHQVIEQYQISHLHFVPSMLSAYLQGTKQLPWPQSVRQVFCSGEALGVNECRLMAQLAPDVSLDNLYGPTEAAIDVSYYPCNLLDEQDITVPIGRPIDNIQLHIADDQGRWLPVGAVGELYIAGRGLARGYLAQAELTNRSFCQMHFVDDGLSSPSSNGASVRSYRTGDLVRLNEQGQIEYCGRCDAQVKLRGFRIELGDIEAQLRAFDDVQGAVVLLLDGNGASSAKLVAFVLSCAPVSELAGQLATKLPSYMVPSVWVALEDMPVGVTGKADRKALLRHYTSGKLAGVTIVVNGGAGGHIEQADLSQGVFSAPKTELEKQLAEIWAQVLGIELSDIGQQSNFFALGGHSLTAVSLLAQIEYRLGIEVPLQSLFDCRDLAEFSGLVADISAGAGVDKQVARAATIAGSVIAGSVITASDDYQQGQSLSFAQQRLWFIDQFDGANDAYHMPAVLRWRGPINILLVEQAFALLIERHHSLRTCFIAKDGEPQQHLQSGENFALSRFDLTDASEQQIKEKTTQWLAEPFDLSRDLMLKVAFIHCAKDDGLLLFCMHHIASDGWSVAIVIDEFKHIYQALIKGQQPKLKALDIQYSDYSRWQRHTLSGQALEQQLSFWRQQLADIPAEHGIGLDYPRPAVKQYRGDSVQLSIDSDITCQLLALAKTHQVTPFMLFHGVFSLLISRHSHRHDIVIGTPVANRTQAQLAPLIGFFANTLVLRSNTDFTQLSQLLAHIKQVNLAALTYQQLPFEYLVEQLNVPRNPQHTPVFQIMLGLTEHGGVNRQAPNFDGQGAGLGLEGVRITDVGEHDSSAKFDLNVQLDLSERLTINFNFDCAIFTKAHVEQMTAHFALLLTELTQAPHANIKTLAMLGSQEKHQLAMLNRNNSKVCGFQTDSLKTNVYAMIADNLATQSNRLAVSAEHLGVQLSYQQLNQRVCQLASFLASKGVQQYQVVGICMGRTPSAVIATLAVLRLGAAYVPMDLNYPQQRLQYIVQDSGMQTLLTDGHLADAQQDNLAQFVSLIDVEQAQTQYLQLAPLMPELAPELAPELKLPIKAHDLCYLIYTSGSTGMPKGVKMPHGVLVNFISTMPAQCPLLNEPMSMIQYASAGFDMCFTDIFLTLATGGRLLLIEQALQKDIPQLADFIITHQVERLNLPFAVLAQLSALAEQQQLLMPSLKVIISTAEQLKITPSVRDFFTRHPNCALVNHYGPSETHVVTGQMLSQSVQSWPDIPSIGELLPNIDAYVIDINGQLAPLGAVGELCIGEGAIADGYLNRDELTAERFIHNSALSDGLVYRTGDLVRRFANGQFTYMGRIDAQLKINGYRIEPGEIEQQLCDLPTLSDAVVLVQGQGETQMLVAYVVEHDDRHQELFSPDFSQQIKQQLAEKLPAHMVPGAILRLAQLPTTVNGKVDRNALPKFDRLQLQADFVAAQTDTEQQLTQIYGLLLQLPADKVSCDSSFFALGGHSLLCVKLVAQIKQTFDLQLSVRSVYERADIRSLATLVDTQRSQLWIEQHKQKQTIMSKGTL